jgi:Zn-dependent M28 family amino/carboxypeptidase
MIGSPTIAGNRADRTRSGWIGIAAWGGLLAATANSVFSQESAGTAGYPSGGPQAMAAIDEATFRSHMRFLSDDLLEGRGPASRGDQLAQLYVATQLQGLGLSPAGPSGWLQKVPLVGVVSSAPTMLEVPGPKGVTRLEYFKDYIAVAGKASQQVKVQDAEIVFVGYGIQAPEYQWDDFKGMDLRGKILLMMNNDPSEDPELFEGKKRLYYGRWDYKYEIAARQGAVGAIIIHTTESAGYPFSVIQTSWTGEQFDLRETDQAQLDMRAWVSDEGARQLVTNAGYDLDNLRRQAQQRDFKPVRLGSKCSLSFPCTLREQDTANVLAMLPGSDPELRKDAVIFMAHHDHLGLAAQRNASGDMIYNGAIDNAAGTASLLAIAKAFRSLPTPPRRSILFAVVGAEEQGLLGSKYFARHPTLPAGRMAAVINIDGISFLGRTHDVNVIGGGKSDLDDVLARMATTQKRTVTQDHFPDRGYYYRSDQFSLAKIGVPAVYLHAGIHVVGKEENWGREQQLAWVEKHYHQPTDEYREDWDLSGAVQDAQLLFLVGLEVANRTALPSWRAGDEFEAARKQALQELKQGAP